jgi:hypothetical protein
MAKIDSTKRYILIINKLRRQKRVTFQYIAGYLQRESEFTGSGGKLLKKIFSFAAQQKDERIIRLSVGYFHFHTA